MNFYQDIFFKSLDLMRGRNTISRLHFLRQSQYWTRDCLLQWQLDKLNDLLIQAKGHSPYYQSILRDIRLPLRQVEDMRELPLLTKDDLRSHYEDIQVTNISRDRFIPSRTGGSTGEPTVYFWDKRGQDWNRASVYRSQEWAGVKLGEKTIQMTGSHFDYGEAQKLKNRLVYLLQRYRDMSVAYITEDILEKYYQEFVKFKPSSIWGYATGLAAFADYVERIHGGIDFPFLKAIITSSETLLPSHRGLINRVFGGDAVYDHYGSREMYMASECGQHDGYHLHAEVLYAEVVDAQGNPCAPGELGRIIFTDLSNHVFPFIRYEIGDMAVLEEPDTICACGVTLPKIKRVEGRIADIVKLSDRILTPPNFTIVMSDFEGISAYQIRQPNIDQLDVLLVVNEKFNQAFFQYIKEAITEMVGGKAKVEVHIVDEIKVPESGKRRYVISDVAVNYH